VLEILERRALHAATVDWPAARRELAAAVRYAAGPD
jgi:hypothetical protein